MGADNAILKAIWIRLFTVKYTMNGASTAAPPDQNSSDQAVITLASEPSRPGYTFTGWKDQSGAIYPASNPTTPSNMTVDSDSYLLYAQWTPTNYTVSYSLAGGTSTPPSDSTVNIGNLISIAAAPTRSGYSFIGWSFDSQIFGAGANIVAGASNISFIATWSAINYSITYDMNGSTTTKPSVSDKTIGQTFSTAATPSRAGYTFAGWSDGSTTYAAGAQYTVASSDVTLTATWTPVAYSLSYNVNGGNSAAPSGASNLNIGDTFTVASSPTHLNRTFLGWSDGTNTFTPGQTYTVGSNDVTLSALWSGINYRITYDLNGGSGIVPTESTRQEGATFVVKSNDGFARSNHNFAGWNSAANGSGTSYANGQTVTVSNSDITLFAQWTPFMAVTFATNGGTAISNVTYTGAPVQKPANPIRTNFVFEGWLDNGNLVDWTSYKPTGPVNLQAKWTPASLYGLDPSFLVRFGDLVASDSVSSTFSASNSTNAIKVEVPAGSLPEGTKIYVDLVIDKNRAITKISSANEYLLSFVISWQAPDGTVPHTAENKPILITLNNADIKAGSVIYKSSYNAEIGDTIYQAVGRSMQDGVAVIEMTEDPELVVAKVKPDSPTNVSGESLASDSINVTWDAPVYNGGSEITSYTATTTSGQSCISQSPPTNSCTITGLSSSTNYTFSVVATNEKGNSTASSSASVTTLAAYAVTYNANNATGGSAPSNQSKTYGISLTLATNSGNLSRTGYTFAGWNTASDGTGTDYVTGSSYTLNSALNLFAKWTPDTYTVTFDINGATGGSAPDFQVKTFDVPLTLATNSGTLVRTNSTFAGWNTANDGSGTDYLAGGSYTGNGALALYAKWTAITYNVTYSLNGGSGSAPSNQTKSFDVALTLASTSGSITKSGYSLLGWNTASDGSGTDYAEGSLYELNGALDLFAKWNPDTYLVAFDSKSGSIVTNSSFVTDGSVSAPPAPTRTGYSFDGWSATDGGSAITFPYSPGVMQAITLYAKWTANSNTVTFKPNYSGGPSDTTQSITTGVATNLTSNVLTRTGYTFAGWNSESNGSGANYADGQSITIDSALPLFAMWTANDNTVTFKSNYAGGDPDTTQIITTDVATNLSSNSFFRTGFTFAGWNTESNGSGTSYSDGQSVSINSALPLFAQWTDDSLISYPVTFKSNHLSGGADTTQNITNNVPTNLSANGFTRTGYSFEGWNTESDGSGTDYTNGESVTINNSLTLYAKWGANSNQVTFKSNFAGGQSDTTQGITTDVSTNLTDNTFTRTGYTFIGWNSEPTGTGTNYTNGQSITINNAITLYAKWSANSYLVTFNSNGGSAVANTSFITNGSISEPTAPTRAGFAFSGWSATDGGSTITFPYTPGLTQAITLYAKWSVYRSLWPAISLLDSSRVVVPSVGFDSHGSGLPVQFSYTELPLSGSNLIEKVEFLNGLLYVKPIARSSGKTQLSIRFIQDSAISTFEVPFEVLPQNAVAPTLAISSLDSNTLNWGPSTDALSYIVRVDGSQVCFTKATTCSITGTIRPSSIIQVVSLGRDGTESKGVTALITQPQKLKIRSIPAAKKLSSRLSKSQLSSLDQVVGFISDYGYKSIDISQIRITGPSFAVLITNQAIANKRIDEIRRYLRAALPGYPLTFTISNPVGAGKSHQITVSK